MKPATIPETSSLTRGMGSEYMDARTYLKQAPRAQPVRESDPDSHGSNASTFGATEIVAHAGPGE